MPTRPIVIAHRGASGYLPEHTLVAKALAVGMGADYVEQDVVATREGELIVFHDLTLDATTNVRERFPARARSDGHFYCRDFSLDELRTLGVSERREQGQSTPRYPGRFPAEAGHFPIVTLDEEIRFIQGLNRSTGRRVGIYPEIKNPAWHRGEGVDVGERLLRLLGRYGYDGPQSRVFVQCFDPEELRRLRHEHGSRLRQVLLLDSQSGVLGPQQLQAIATYAEAIGPSLRLLEAHGARPETNTLVRDAHAAGLQVHPYTLRRDELPAGIDNFDELLDLVLRQLRADGLFTDFPDLAVAFVASRFGRQLD
jgi:glycerophosphoryl diester phosphodiesterase